MRHSAQLAALTMMTMALAAMAAGPTLAGQPAAQPSETDFPSNGRVRMDLCSSGVEIRGTKENKIRVSYDSRGDTDRVEVRLKTSGSEGSLEVDGCPHDNFHLTIEVPRLADLHVRMWGGQLLVSDVTGDKDLELHAGQMEVEVGKIENYARVDASVVTGEVDAAPFRVSKGGLFRSFERTGPGRYRLHAHVGAGQVVLK